MELIVSIDPCNRKQEKSLTNIISHTSNFLQLCGRSLIGYSMYSTLSFAVNLYGKNNIIKFM